MAKIKRWRKAAKIEFTQILEDLNGIDADAAMTQQEGDIVETKVAKPPLDEGVNEELNQLEIAGRSNSANRHSNSYASYVAY